MGCGDKGAGFWVPGFGDFMEEKLLVLALGDCVYLSPRVDLSSHHCQAILGEEHQIGLISTYCLWGT